MDEAIDSHLPEKPRDPVLHNEHEERIFHDIWPRLFAFYAMNNIYDEGEVRDDWREIIDRAEDSNHDLGEFFDVVGLRHFYDVADGHTVGVAAGGTVAGHAVSGTFTDFEYHAFFLSLRGVLERNEHLLFMAGARAPLVRQTQELFGAMEAYVSAIATTLSLDEQTVAKMLMNIQGSTKDDILLFVLNKSVTKKENEHNAKFQRLHEMEETHSDAMRRVLLRRQKRALRNKDSSVEAINQGIGRPTSFVRNDVLHSLNDELQRVLVCHKQFLGVKIDSIQRILQRLASHKRRKGSDK